jgi:hypothetical protein
MTNSGVVVAGRNLLPWLNASEFGSDTGSVGPRPIGVLGTARELGRMASVAGARLFVALGEICAPVVLREFAACRNL